MAPKKKSKANKLAKMSDEERARYLQHRADIEEEAKRRKQELISRFMKNKLHKEEVFSRVNLAKINQNWRFILRKLKVKEMEQEVQAMISSFTRVTDSKNAVISRLMTSLEESEDQYSRMLQSHMEMISFFLEICADRLKFFQDNYEQQKDALIEKWEEELQSMEYNNKESQYNLKLIIFQQNENMKKYVDENTTERAHSINAHRLKFEQEINDMKVPKQLRMESIWNEMRTIFSNFVSYHSPKIQEYHILRQKDSMFRKEINQHMDQLLITSDIITHHQQEWENLKENIELGNKKNREQYNEVNTMYINEKIKIIENQNRDKENLMTLSVESSNAIKKLNIISKKLKKIIQMEAICKKYETESEKVVPWDNITGPSNQNSSLLPGELMDNVKTFELLENFWFKLNRVTVHVAALKAERDSLKQENKYLKGCLKNVLMEAALGDLKGSNTEISGRPASIKMFRINANIIGSCEPIIRRPVTCIDGNTCNAVQHEKRMARWKSANQLAQRVIVRRQCW